MRQSSKAMTTRSSYKEALIGASFLALLIFAIVDATGRVFDTQSRSSQTYELLAVFADLGGASTGTPITLGGIVIGRIAEIQLDPNRLQAKTRLLIDSRYRIPRDSSIAAGGSQLILTLGRERATLDAGSYLDKVVNYSSLEQKIGTAVFGQL